MLFLALGGDFSCKLEGCATSTALFCRAGRSQFWSILCFWMQFKERKLFWKQRFQEHKDTFFFFFFPSRLCQTKWSANLEFISKTWCCWHAAPLHERYPSNCLRGKGGVVYCALDARPCCRMIVWLGGMINVTPKGSEEESLRTCPPTVTVNKASLDVGLLKIHEKAEEDGNLFSLQHTHAHTLFSPSRLIMSKHLHLVEYQQAFLQICAFQLVFPGTDRPLQPPQTRGIPHAWVLLLFPHIFQHFAQS